MTKGELVKLLEEFNDDSEILVDLGFNKVKPIALVLWGPQPTTSPDKIYLRIEE